MQFHCCLPTRYLLSIPDYMIEAIRKEMVLIWEENKYYNNIINLSYKEIVTRVHFSFNQNGFFSTKNELINIPKADIPNLVYIKSEDEVISFRRSYKMLNSMTSHKRVCLQFMSVLSIFLGGDREVARNVLSKQLPLQSALSGFKQAKLNVELKFLKITEMMVQIEINSQRHALENKGKMQKAMKYKKI